jgi:hypothetical protein
MKQNCTSGFPCPYLLAGALFVHSVTIAVLLQNVLKEIELGAVTCMYHPAND